MKKFAAIPRRRRHTCVRIQAIVPTLVLVSIDEIYEHFIKVYVYNNLHLIFIFTEIYRNRSLNNKKSGW